MIGDVTVGLHPSQPRNSAALPPTGLWGEGLAADGWADTGGICFIAWFSICGLKIWVSNTFTSFIMLSVYTERSKLQLPLSHPHHIVAKVMNQKII